MKRTSVWVKTIAIVGTVLTAVPILAPLVLTRWGGLGTGHFNFDWLMPAELFPLALVGGMLVFVAAVREHSHRALVGWGVVVAGASLAVALGFASASGLASGAIPAVGLPVVFVTAMIAVYTAAVAEIVVAGILLIRDLLGHRDHQSHPAVPAM